MKGCQDMGNGFIWTDEEMAEPQHSDGRFCFAKLLARTFQTPLHPWPLELFVLESLWWMSGSLLSLLRFFPAIAQMPLGSANDFGNILGWGQLGPKRNDRSNSRKEKDQGRIVFANRYCFCLFCVTFFDVFEDIWSNSEHFWGSSLVMWPAAVVPVVAGRHRASFRLESSLTGQYSPPWAAHAFQRESSTVPFLERNNCWMFCIDTLQAASRQLQRWAKLASGLPI